LALYGYNYVISASEHMVKSLDSVNFSQCIRPEKLGDKNMSKIIDNVLKNG